MLVNFLSIIAENENVKKNIVFGSRAIGDYETYSDLDLAIDALDISKLEWLKLKEYAISRRF